jgi:hypothetical protein
MRTISFIIAFSFALAGSSFSSTTDSSLPGVGSFTYNGPQPLPDATSNKVAYLTLTRRA